MLTGSLYRHLREGHPKPWAGGGFRGKPHILVKALREHVVLVRADNERDATFGMGPVARKGHQLAANASAPMVRLHIEMMHITPHLPRLQLHMPHQRNIAQQRSSIFGYKHIEGGMFAKAKPDHLPMIKLRFVSVMRGQISNHVCHRLCVGVFDRSYFDLCHVVFFQNARWTA